MSQPTLVFIVNRCFMSNDCHTNFNSSQNLRRHLSQVHEFDFPNRIKRPRLHNSELYMYLSEPSAPSNQTVSIQSICPVCDNHFEEVAALKAHFVTTHQEHLPSQQHEHDQSRSSTPSEASVVSSQSIPASDTMGQKRHSDEALCLDGVTLDQPLGEHLIINGFDVSVAFHNMKMTMKANKWKLSLEDNLLLALSATSVLLLDGCKYPDEVKPFFAYEQWRMTDEHIQQVYGIKRQPIPLRTTTELSSTLDQLLNKVISRDEAEIILKSMPLSTMEKKIAKTIANLVSKLPLVAIEENVNEMELCSRFIDPFLAGLFDDPDNDIYLRWLDEITLEAKAKDSSSTRPDMSVTKSCGVRWATTLAYGEAKPAIQGDDHYVVCRDLIKVARFCKDALDSQQFDGILAVQIIGRSVVFYLLTLPATSLYTMIPLATIKVPNSLNELPGLIYKVPDILKVLDCFDRVCVRAAQPETVKKRFAPTLSMAKIEQLFSLSKSPLRSVEFCNPDLINRVPSLANEKMNRFLDIMSRPTYNHLPTNLKNRYVIARHGFSLANNAGLICSDPAIAIPEAEGPLGTGWGLHDRGKEQVKASASLLVKHLTSKGSPLTDESIVIFCSPFLRTRQTAEIFRSTLNETLSLNIAPATPNLSLRERFYGDYDMKSDENYKTCWADDATGPDHGEHSSSGVESPSSVCDRTTQFILDEIENKVQGKVVLLVAHGDVCQIMQTAFLSMEAYRHREVEHVETASWREMEA